MTRHKTPIIIAHRGASGYLPEHTLEAKAMAHALGADYLEQDLVLTRDDVPIVLHDIHLDTVTDVADLFPGRAHGDGRYYAIDFTLEEIRRLTVSERFDPKTQKAVFPKRFPAHQGRFRIPTLVEELELIQGLNSSTRRGAGIYPELKQPQFHHQAGKDIARIAIEILKDFGYHSEEHLCYLQCFDFGELKRIRHELGCRLPLIQLLEERDCSSALANPEQLKALMQQIAGYADGIGPNLISVFPIEAAPTSPSHLKEETKRESRLVAAAHHAGLVVHPWTYRADALPKNFSTFEELHQATIAAHIDGIFTDFPDQSRELFRSHMNPST
ncbi:glycerophosphodiester phosphodiesterase [Planctomicrobium piriforme]|uniref:glycerophosphodiester phosphodiesterase n=1 Tax=Planctomicrobium piriforme TaxID=1576369 RepID=A0A1I3NQI6_9PLAN|nr:glycerophosphodiester phosphodiesterase [Planctomicrobium piriforme]SFJ11469.1 glycerophosphoryl diester phosphodiesterase [Planctomicrobium piriforme]